MSSWAEMIRPFDIGAAVVEASASRNTVPNGGRVFRLGYTDVGSTQRGLNVTCTRMPTAIGCPLSWVGVKRH